MFRISEKICLLTALALVAYGSARARADNMAYVVVEGYSPASVQFGTLDLNTGLYTAINSNAIPAGNKTVNGLAISNGKLYAVDRGTDLYQVDPTTGDFTLVGNGGPSDQYYTIGSTTSGGLYGLDMDGDLYSVNPVTGNATDLGSTVNLSSSTGPYYPLHAGLSNGSSTLYYAEPDPNIIATDFYSLDTANGSATFLSQNTNGVIGITPLLYENGTLYGDLTEYNGTQWIATIDSSNGNVTLGSAIHPTDGGNLSIMGMVPYFNPATVPLPASALGGSALMALLGLNRYRKSLF